MGDNTVRDELGWVLTILTGIVVAVNVLIFLWKTFWNALVYVKRAVACFKLVYERLST
jgi:hypothetical protein